MNNEIFKVYKIAYTKTGTIARIWEVSNIGRVKCNGEIVEPYMHNRYLRISSFKIHRAVAELFVPNPENKPFVDHINTDRLDNRAENLRWVTYKENNNNPLTKQHFSEAHRGNVLTADRKRKISESLKGRSRKPLSEEAKQKISIAHKGKTHTEETKQKMSASRKGRTLSEEHKQKLREAWAKRKKRGN